MQTLDTTKPVKMINLFNPENIAHDFSHLAPKFYYKETAGELARQIRIIFRNIDEYFDECENIIQEAADPD